MSIFNDKALKGVAEAVSKIVDEELKGNQHKIDANKNGKVDADYLSTLLVALPSLLLRQRSY